MALLRPWTPGEEGSDASVDFAQGRFTDAVLRGYLHPQGPLQGVGEINLNRKALQTITFDGPQMDAALRVVNEMKGKGQRYLVWARPGEKPELIEVGKAEQLTCPKCGEALEPGATRLAKLSNAFHDVFRCPGCKHIFSPSNCLGFGA